MESFNKSSTPIKTWAIDDRPREKLALKGSSALSDSELLAILINTGSGKQSALDLAKSVFNLCDNKLSELGKLSLEQLMALKGIGEAKAITIVAAMELARRRQEEPLHRRDKIINSIEAAQFLKTHLKDYAHEVFAVLFLNAGSRLLGYEIISYGGLSQTIVDPKIIFNRALALKASSLILSHNHPSGNLNPSNADKVITQRIVEGAKLLDIKVVDHIIVSDDGYYSFADEGLI